MWNDIVADINEKWAFYLYPGMVIIALILFTIVIILEDNDENGE